MSKRQGSAATSNPAGSTRELILDEAERLIATKGVNGFTLKEVVTPLGVQIPSVYKHYRNRDDVLIALARRYITIYSQQFSYPAEGLQRPSETLRNVVEQFVRFHIEHPAYVRLSLVDFATPDGGVEYIRLAAGGPFRSNLSTGPLAAMHRRLDQLMIAGHSKGEFRAISALDFLRVVKSALLVRLVFPDDLLLNPKLQPNLIATLESWAWDLAYSYAAKRPDCRCAVNVIPAEVPDTSGQGEPQDPGTLAVS
jgi:AcrR family transcriptional regulator